MELLWLWTCLHVIGRLCLRCSGCESARWWIHVWNVGQWSVGWFAGRRWQRRRQRRRGWRPRCQSLSMHNLVSWLTCLRLQTCAFCDCLDWALCSSSRSHSTQTFISYCLSLGRLHVLFAHLTIALHLQILISNISLSTYVYAFWHKSENVCCIIQDVVVSDATMKWVIRPFWVTNSCLRWYFLNRL